MKHLFLLLALLLSHPAWAGATFESDITRAELLSEKTAVVAGEPLRVGVLLRHSSGWHTYWKNPGDAGIPTAFEWQLPVGITASSIDWPPPTRTQEGELVTYAYKNEVFLPVTLTIPSGFSARELPLTLKASWLVCLEICIPESAELSLTLPVAASAESSASSFRFGAHDAAKPQTLAAGTFSVHGTQLILTLPYADGASSAYFFPEQQNVIRYGVPQILEQKEGTLSLTINRSDAAPPQELSGVLQVNDRAYEVRFGEKAAGTTQKPSEAPPAFLLVLLFAFLGGLVLNLMPCVLPVLSLKVLALVGHAKNPATMHRHGVAYTLGIMTAFALVAGVLIALQQAGSSVGWGYQMQSPVFVLSMSLLLFAIGLNLSGYFELPVLLGNIETRQDTVRGSFATGLLAAAVATPCTAPFMASAVGVALTQPPLIGMLIFQTLALGLAFPFLLVSFIPAAARLLPKPGAWMERLRQLLAFPMFASVIWLLWVLTLQAMPHGLVVALSCMLAVMLGLWLLRALGEYRAWRFVAWLWIACAVAFSLISITPQEPMKETAYTPQALAALQAEGKPVFLDATAAWCITCQVNKRVAIDTEATRALFAERGVTLMVADWTNRNPDITALLTRFGYKGVPLYIYFPTKGEPVVLPQLLTESIIRDTITSP